MIDDESNLDHDQMRISRKKPFFFPNTLPLYLYIYNLFLIIFQISVRDVNYTVQVPEMDYITTIASLFKPKKVEKVPKKI